MTQSESERAATRAPVGQGKHFFGVPGRSLVSAALGEVLLRPDQRSELERVATESDPAQARIETLRDEVIELVASQIEQNAYDFPVVEAKFEAYKQSWEHARPVSSAALDRIHAILDPAQRAELVDVLWGKLKAHELSQQFELSYHLEDQLKGVASGVRGGRRTDPWITPNMNTEKFERNVNKIFDAFKQERFVFDEIAPPFVDPRQAKTLYSIRFVEMALPILTTPEQRSILANNVRQQMLKPIIPFLTHYFFLMS